MSSLNCSVINFRYLAIYRKSSNPVFPTVRKALRYAEGFLFARDGSKLACGRKRVNKKGSSGKSGGSMRQAFFIVLLVVARRSQRAK